MLVHAFYELFSAIFVEPKYISTNPTIASNVQRNKSLPLSMPPTAPKTKKKPITNLIIISPKLRIHQNTYQTFAQGAHSYLASSLL
jgi:hypothetical protein